MRFIGKRSVGSLLVGQGPAGGANLCIILHQKPR
jgi:hypothetical protein